MPELEAYDYAKDGGPEEPGYDDFYLRLRRDTRAWVAKHTTSDLADLVLNVPDFFYLLVKLARDARVPAANKRQIVCALAYFLSPIDVIPDFLGGLGWLDDLYIALIVTDNLMNAVDPEIVRGYWLGDGELLDGVKRILDRLNDRLGAGAIRRLLAKLRDDGGEEAAGE